MNRAMAIARREFSSYFYSPIAYVVIITFLIASGFAFYRDFEPGQAAAMRSTLDWMVWFLVIIVPVLSMGLLAQEWASGTIETLMTAPVSDSEVVIGKFFGNLGLLVVMLLPTLLYVVLLTLYSRPDFGPIFSGYLGIFLVGALFVAVGLFCSSLTRNQIVAVVLAILLLCLATVIPYLIAQYASLRPVFRTVIDQAVYRRYSDFSRGVLSTGNIVFFVLTTAVFLFLTVKVLESRRWK
ncbi:MAG TPA: ABC transporter permease [Tepidisphaeraceae bacterium]|jgi:ABC-2 type transport system permease protein|nr:ABC transporter permease [Tepidisphaeraceae bacterium]